MDDIKAWLQSPNKDYTQGVALLVKYHKNKMLIRHFQNANPNFNAKNLEYVLKKLTGIPLTVLFAENAPKAKPAQVTSNVLPAVIIQAKNTVYELFTSISIIHRQLFELRESNQEDIVKQRKELLEKRLPLIQRYEQIYLLKEQYFNTGIIAPELPLLLEEHSKTGVEIENIPDNSPDCKLQLLSGVELMKKKQATTVAINKIQNRLQYQSLTKSEQPNPMPPSPVRDKLEGKLAMLKEDLKIILQLIENQK